MQSPPPSMMYSPQPQQHTAWITPPLATGTQQQPMMLALACATGVKKVERKMLWPTLTWEECWDGEGNMVWINAETGKLVRNDPHK